MPPHLDRGFVVGWLVPWSLFTLAFDGVLAWGACRQAAATFYPRVPGVVTHSGVALAPGADGDATWRTDLRYEYAVGGVRYTGTRYRYGEWSTNDGGAARVARAYPVGRRVEVYHHPTDPSDAVLRPGVRGFDLTVALFLAPFNAVMVCGWYLVWRDRRRPARPFGRLPVTREGRRTRVRLRDPVPGAVAAAGAAGFVLIFAVVIYAGFDPPLSVAAAAWGVVLGAAAVVYRVGPGVGRLPRELVLDGDEDTMELYGRSRRVPGCVIPASAVREVTRSATLTEGEDGETRVTGHTAAVSYAGPDGDERSEPLGEWGVPETAEAVVAGVREWLARRGADDAPAD